MPTIPQQEINIHNKTKINPKIALIPNRQKNINKHPNIPIINNIKIKASNIKNNNTTSSKYIKKYT